MLYVISAKMEMSWVSFKEAFDYLYRLDATASSVELDGINYKRFQTVRALDSLGHCDFDYRDDGSKVYAAPPVLVRLPCAGFPQAILAGARSPQTIQQLSTACKSIGNHIINLEVTEQASELVLVPQRVAVQAEDVGELQAIANSLKIPFLETPSAWSLLHFAADIDNYLGTLQWYNSPELTWKRETFDLSCLQFRSSSSTAGGQGVRLCRYSHPSRNTKICYLWQNGSCTQIDLDWGRYAILKVSGLNVLIYDKRRFIMAVPASAKLPRLLERALILCSGYAARYIENLPGDRPEIRGFTLFQAIPPQIAEITAAKLSQTLLLQDTKL